LLAFVLADTLPMTNVLIVFSVLFISALFSMLLLTKFLPNKYINTGIMIIPNMLKAFNNAFTIAAIFPFISIPYSILMIKKAESDRVRNILSDYIDEQRLVIEEYKRITHELFDKICELQYKETK
jgi:hypothetical protein